MANPEDIDAALTSLAQVKAEHREILRQVASDPGMAPETRNSLIQHLYDEEDEHLAEIQAMRGGGGGASSAHAIEAPGPPSSSGLTVGSLRADPAPIQATKPGSLSVGSLRT